MNYDIKILIVFQYIIFTQYKIVVSNILKKINHIGCGTCLF